MLLTLLLILPFVAGLLCLPVQSRVWLERFNLATFTLVAVLAGAVGAEVYRLEKLEALGGFLYADSLSALVIGLTAFVALVCAIYAVGYFRRDQERGRINLTQLRIYYSLTPLFVGAMLLVTLANSLGVMWVALEATTLASVLLIAFYNLKTSLEAAWKYIIIGSVGISLALFGTILTYYSAVDVLGQESTNGLNWTVLVQLAEKLNPDVMLLAFIMVLLGYGTKAGLVPMHTWKPDAYAEAPVPAAALLGAGVINCSLYGLMRFHALSLRCLGPDYSGNLLLGFGLGSMALAAPFVLVQRNFRRLLAYSSIEHAGIMVAALGFGGRLGVLAALLHMVFHATIKPLLFFCAGNVQQQFDTPYLRKVRGLIHVMPVTAVLFLVAMLAMTGTPPFSLFQSEFMILSAAVAAHHEGLAGFFVLCVVTIFAGFLQHLVPVNLGLPLPALRPVSACAWKGSALWLVAVITVVLAFWLPDPIYEMVERSAQIIRGGE